MIQQHLAVMHFAVIDVEVQAAICCEHAPRFHQARLDKCHEVIENVVICQRPKLEGLITPALEPHPVAALSALRAQPGAFLRLARVEGRIDVDQLHRPVGQAAQQIQVVAEVDPVHRVTPFIPR